MSLGRHHRSFISIMRKGCREEYHSSIHTFTEDKKNLAQHTQGKKKATLIVIPSVRFTKLIIFHLQRKHKFHPRPESPLHLPTEEPILGYLKFSAKGTKREVFGMPIPNELITDDIRGADYYDAYLKKVAKHQRYLAGEEVSDPDSPAPKPAKSTKPKITKQAKPVAPKAATKKPQPAPTKPKEKKRKQAKETTEATPPAKRAKAGKVAKKRTLKRSQQLVDEFVDEGIPLTEPGFGDLEADTQRAIEESLKDAHGAHRDIMTDVNASVEQAPSLAPPTRTDEQILPRIRWVPIGKSNCYLDAKKSQSNLIYKIAVDILKHTNFFRAFTTSSTIPAIYIQQFWDTICYDRTDGGYKCQLDEQWFNLTKDTLRDALQITPVNNNKAFSALTTNINLCHKLLTDQVDDAILRYNVSKPLPLGGDPGHVTIQPDLFFNKDLEYLWYGRKIGRPALSISKMKAAYYPDVGLEQMVPDQMWIEEECKYDVAAMYVIDSPRAVTFRDKYRVQIIIRFNEIHKFSDGTLHQIDEALDYRVKEFRVNRRNPGLDTRFWTKKDVDRSKEFLFAIQKRLKTRRIFQNLESFVGGRIREGDYRLLKRTE
ncbi:hypothetical protein Tco_0454136 [Tanacetum coccineum]